MIKAVFIDIDGTLTNSKREISKATKDAINRCMNKGINIILSSGRSRYDTLIYQSEISASKYIISSNGANIFDIERNLEIYNETISKESIIKLMEYAYSNDHKITLNYGSNLAVSKAIYPDENDKKRTKKELRRIIENNKIVQCAISDKDIEKLIKFKLYFQKEITDLKIENESKRLKNFELKPSSNYFCDIVSSSASKGKAVKILCEYLKIEKEDIIVIGDGYNDISMFKETKNSVAMGNSMEDVKKMAKYITNTNDEDGVAEVLNKVLNK